MSGPSRYRVGGFESRFIVRRADGKPCRPEARYIVLDGGGADPHAIVAIRAYAEAVRVENPEFAADLDRMLDGDWPAESAQHVDAK